MGPTKTSVIAALQFDSAKAARDVSAGASGNHLSAAAAAAAVTPRFTRSAEKRETDPSFLPLLLHPFVA